MKVAVPQSTVSWEAAHAAVAAAVRHAEALGLRVNVGVADAAGNLVAFLRMPGAFPSRSTSRSTRPTRPPVSVSRPASGWTWSPATKA